MCISDEHSWFHKEEKNKLFGSKVAFWEGSSEEVTLEERLEQREEASVRRCGGDSASGGGGCRCKDSLVGIKACLGTT